MRLQGFDPLTATQRLQEAVRCNDVGALQDLVSERMLFASARSLLTFGASGFTELLGRDEWLAAARHVEWVRFDVQRVRSLDLGAVMVVDCRLTQVARYQGQQQKTKWVVTDVWSLEEPGWRLVARHPELASGEE